ncbi:Lyso-phosphatidylcholine acyltransferase [Coemansia sp. RSA 1972]|nr:Lyso-phosphatidylcholine acyltransferase [Coemansia sp. RSA 1972]
MVPDRSRAQKLIDQLPRQTWHERSFAYWAEKQLAANDSWWKPLSTAVVGTATTTMSLFLRLGFRKVVVDDLHKLTNVLERERNRPIVTVANHESTADDPMIWGVMPAHLWWKPDCTRWTLGAQELLYKHPLLNAFFALGQTIPTVRGDGIYQLAVEIGLRKLNENKWVHVFPEGKVNQEAQMLCFKWGVGRMIMEAERTPIVVPMFFTGTKHIMPLRQKVPVPRPNPLKSTLYVRVGDAVDFAPFVSEWKATRAKLSSEEAVLLDEQVRIAIVDQLWGSMVTTIGTPRIINSTAALMDAVPETIKEKLPKTSLRCKDEYDYDVIRQRGIDMWKSVYSKQAEKLEGKIGSWYPDLLEVIQTDLYGRILSDCRILDAKSTELCTIGALFPSNVPAQLKSHVLGAGRHGASSDEIEAAKAIAQLVCIQATALCS